jgi:hypothetical protein
MDHRAAPRPGPTPEACRHTHPARGLIRWISNNNPFYALSAVLVLIGLRMSFDPAARVFPAWAFLSGLAAYTVLMAFTACALVRLGNVWEDVRTLLLLIVVAFVAIAMLFDDVLIKDHNLGRLFNEAAALFAIALSEATLRGMRLRLPPLYRIPYYLSLALIFLYPVALVPWLDRPGDPRLSWAIFGFSPAAALTALTLLPAIRRGPAYVARTGAPWRWPLYPWSLFVILGLGLVARSASLCWSMQAPSFPELGQSVFRPYFLVPLGLAVSVLVLELGLVSRSPVTTRLALTMPAALLVLAMLGHEPGALSVSGRFLENFTTHLGGTPLHLTLLAAIAFYSVASLRQVPSASAWLTVSLATLSLTAPETLTLADPSSPQPAPLWAAAALQGLLALRNPTSARLAIASALSACAVSVSPIPPMALASGPTLALNLAIASALAIGAFFRDDLARFLQAAALVALPLASLKALTMLPAAGAGLEQALLQSYPLLAASVALAYGLWLRHRPALASAVLTLIAWASVAGSRGYTQLRPLVAGLDQITLGLASFALAALVSLAKAGVLARWLAGLRKWGHQLPGGPSEDF